MEPNEIAVFCALATFFSRTGYSVQAKEPSVCTWCNEFLLTFTDLVINNCTYKFTWENISDTVN